MAVLGSINARVRQELLSYSMIVPGYKVHCTTSGKKVHVDSQSCSHEQKRRKRLQQSYLHSVHGRNGATVDSVWRLPGHSGQESRTTHPKCHVSSGKNDYKSQTGIAFVFCVSARLYPLLQYTGDQGNEWLMKYDEVDSDGRLTPKNRHYEPFHCLS